MSTSPQPTSTKRPLEDVSSPSRTGDQPEAKRPALDKVLRNDGDIKESNNGLPAIPPAPIASGESNGKTNGEKKDQPDSSAGSHNNGASAAVVDGAEPKSAGSTANNSSSSSSNNNHNNSASAPAANAHDETAWIHIRAVISSPEAATIIGKGGENVSKIRQMSNAKCTVSDYQKGAIERILTVSGVVDAVAKAFGLIIRTLNNEPLGEASNAHSKTYPLRLLIPHILIGSIIGKGGSRIKEIQEASGARLNASDSCLPLSSERSLVVMGVADAVHIATYYVGSTLLEQLNERFGGPAASAYAARGGGPVGVVPGGMQVVPYLPQPAGGSYGRPDNYNNAGGGMGPGGGGGGGRHRPDMRGGPHMPPQAYGAPYGAPTAPHGPGPAMPMYGAQPAVGAYGAQPLPPHHAGPHHAGPQQPHAGPHGPPMHGGPGAPHAGMPGAPLTQQIFIPNDMVGAIIGKGGQKINEIRQISGSVIKINEPQDNSNERLVTISGTEECNRMALYMLYSRLESEKHRT